MLFLAVFLLVWLLVDMAQFASIRYHSGLSGRLDLIWSSAKFARLSHFHLCLYIVSKQPLRVFLEKPMAKADPNLNPRHSLSAIDVEKMTAICAGRVAIVIIVSPFQRPSTDLSRTMLAGGNSKRWSGRSLPPACQVPP